MFRILSTIHSSPNLERVYGVRGERSVWNWVYMMC